MSPDHPTKRSRLLAVGMGSILATALGSLLWRAWRPPDRSPLELREPSAELRGLLEKGIDPASVEWIPARAGSGLMRFRMTDELAELLWGMSLASHATDEFDPHAYYRSRGLLDIRHPWPEHPGGEWRMRTNSLGLRRDGELSPERPELRILVTGDSHTDGVCDNQESFSSLLEAALAPRFPDGEAEVLNAGKFGYSFYNYLGTLERFVPLAPHGAIVVVYGGNDFRELLPLYHLFTGQPPPPRLVVDLEAYRQAALINRPVLGQAWMTHKSFQLHPEWAELALETALKIAREKRALATEAGIRLLVAYLPPVTDLPGGRRRPDFEQIAQILELSEQDLAITDLLADRYLAGLEELGIETIDLRPVLAGHAEEAYWHADLHLAPEGHRLVAEALLPRVLAWLDQR